MTSEDRRAAGVEDNLDGMSTIMMTMWIVEAVRRAGPGHFLLLWSHTLPDSLSFLLSKVIPSLSGNETNVVFAL